MKTFIFHMIGIIWLSCRSGRTGHSIRQIYMGALRGVEGFLPHPPGSILEMKPIMIFNTKLNYLWFPKSNLKPSQTACIWWSTPTNILRLPIQNVTSNILPLLVFFGVWWTDSWWNFGFSPKVPIDRMNLYHHNCNLTTW